MTVSTTASRITYAGNDVTTAFAFPYLFLANSHLLVTLVAADSTETTQVITTNYTVTGAGLDAGGTVTMIVPPATGETLVISRNTTIDQETDYQANDTFPAETHESALDKLTLICQELDTTLDRALTLSEGDTGTDFALPTPSADNLIGWNATADALQNYSQSVLDVTLVPPLEADKVLGANAAANAFEFKFTVPSASANTVLGWNSGATDIENKNAVLADLTDNLSVGYTTDIFDYSTTASITIDFTGESLATWTPAANATINEDSVNGLQVILCTPSANISLSAGSNVVFDANFAGSLTSGTEYVITVAKFGSTETKVIVSEMGT